MTFKEYTKNVRSPESKVRAHLDAGDYLWIGRERPHIGNRIGESSGEHLVRQDHYYFTENKWKTYQRSPSGSFTGYTVSQFLGWMERYYCRWVKPEDLLKYLL